MTSPTDPRSVRTRARVQDAAWALLNEVGFDGITVDLVSERSGVARSTLYRHWRSLPELLRDAFAAQAAHRPPAAATDHAPAAVRSTGEGSCSEGLHALVAYARAVSLGLVHVWGHAAMSLATSALTDPAQRAVQKVFVEGTHRDLLAIVQTGRHSGGLGAEVDDAALVDRLLDLVIAPLFYRFQFTDSPSTTQQASDLAEQAWVLLQQDSGHTTGG